MLHLQNSLHKSDKFKDPSGRVVCVLERNMDVPTDM